MFQSDPSKFRSYCHLIAANLRNTYIVASVYVFTQMKDTGYYLNNLLNKSKGKLIYSSICADQCCLISSDMASKGFWFWSEVCHINLDVSFKIVTTPSRWMGCWILSLSTRWRSVIFPRPIYICDWVRKCNVRCLLCINAFSHTSHFKSLLTMWTQVSIFRWSLLENLQLHTSQAKCFSPACINTCKFSKPLAKNTQLHISHLRSFFPVQVYMWYSRCASCWNLLPHMNKNVKTMQIFHCSHHNCVSMDMSLSVWSQWLPFTTYCHNWKASVSNVSLYGLYIFFWEYFWRSVTTDSITFFLPLYMRHFVRTPYICDMNPNAFLPEVLDTSYHFHISFWRVLKQWSLQKKINTKALAEYLVSWIGTSCFTYNNPWVIDTWPEEYYLLGSETV
jgi:hypothetical protein